MNNRPVNIFDVSIGSHNIGDQIIMHYLKKELLKLRIISTSPIHYYPTHSPLKLKQILTLRKSHLSFICGSNLLTSKQFKYRQWDVGFKEMILSNFILFGVGWRTYEEKAGWLTKLFLKSILSKKIIHSVRDSYTMNNLKQIGIKNVIMTGCPTTWNLTKELCSEIPQKKSDSVLFTLTDYRRDEVLDKLFINILRRNYRKIYFWPQGIYDYDYLKMITNLDDIFIIPGNLREYEKLLEEKASKIDYIGTRLHGGIMALNYKIRSIIISVDNRSIEMGADLNLTTIKRQEIKNSLEHMIQEEFKTEIHIKESEIKRWKNQFEES